MRILMFSNASVSKQGGAESSFTSLVSGLSERGHEVIEAYHEEDFHHFHREPGDRGVWGLHLPELRTKHKVPTLSSLKHVGRSLYQLACFLRVVQPPVVYVHYVGFSSLYFVLLRPFLGYRLVLGARGSDLLRYKQHNPSLRLFLPLILRAADHLIGVSGAVAEQAETLAPSLKGHTSVIENGVAQAYWQHADSRERGDTKPLIASVGNLRRVKGHASLIRALPTLHQHAPAASVRIAGEGPERSKLEQLASELGVEQKVKFMGWCDPRTIRGLLQTADIFVMPSRSEGLGSALLEAMASGLPCVATRVGGIPEVITHGHDGLMVPPEDPGALGRALVRVLRDPDFAERLGTRAAERAKDFTWEATLDGYERVFQSI